MLRSSLGFHTLTMSLNIEYNKITQLIKHFDKYREKTKSIEMYLPDKKGGNVQVYRPPKGKEYFPIPLQINITYKKKDSGIKWFIKCNYQNDAFKSHFVEVTINPKILGGINDYITAATYDDMETAIENFNNEAKSISSILKDFHHYYMKRVDYCINFSLNELTPGCSHEQIIELIKRADKPPYYEEWAEYDYTAHRTKSKKGSFYLINNSVNINCYSKYIELLERSQKHENSGYSQITPEMLDTARDIIRFEVQCKYRKMYDLNCEAEALGNLDYNKYKSLLNRKTCEKTILYYFRKSIGSGDWFTLQDAVRIILNLHFNKQRENRLIDALYFVNGYRSLAKAKKECPVSDLDAFKRTINELSKLNINPVTIPKDWGIKHIPNLLRTYYEKIQEECGKKEVILDLADHLMEKYDEFNIALINNYD